MNLADLSIKRPVFITSVVVLMLVAGLMFLKRLPVDLFPDVTFPVVVVNVPYRGAGPAEIETLIAKPLENEISTISGIKRLNAIAQEGAGTIVVEFNLDTDIKYAEEQVKTAVSRAKRELPEDIEEPIIRRVDPADQPILIMSLTAKDLSEAKLYDLADQIIRPQLEQVSQVGQVQIFGGREREIHVELDRRKLQQHEISASQVAQRIKASGENVPLGKTYDAQSEMVYRAMGQFQTLDEIKNIVLNFVGNDVPVTVNDVGQVSDTLKDEATRAFVNGEQSLFILAYKQSGANTIAVVDALNAKITKINEQIGKDHSAKISEVRDGSKWVRNNVEDVTHTILIGIVLAVVVVFFFLGSGRSTLITSLALPNSLIGAFILMYLAGFSINIMTLLALTLAVGLLIDDAIVVRENIFRHLEMGKAPIKAALEGAGEVRLAVIATTLAVIAVFGPVGFLQGVVGQFFKEFGLTVCFAMMISLFDALTIAPMLSAYLASKSEHDTTNPGWVKKNLLMPFDRFQTWLEDIYEATLKWVIVHPLKTLGMSLLIFIVSIAAASFVTKTFLPPQDAGEFMVGLSLPPGTSIEKMTEIAQQVDEIIRKNKEVEVSALMVGSTEGGGEASSSNTYVRLVPYKNRSLNTSEVKENVRKQLKDYAYATPTVKDYDAVGGGLRPFNVNITGTDQKKLEEIALKVLEKIKKNGKVSDPDINFRPGKPEFQVKFDQAKLQQLGISTLAAGAEMRTHVDGTVASKYREIDREYDIRVRLQEDQRDLKTYFDQTYIPNINGKLIPLNRIAEPLSTVGPSKVTRQNRIRYVQINGDVAPGAGFADIISDVTKMLTEEEDTKLDEGMGFVFVGQAENFQELGQNMMIAMGLGILFIYFVLASLYESFITPFTIMLALPLAISGSFFTLLIFNESLNIFSWIGIIMLLGVSTKNSILLVDYTNQLVQEGVSKSEAIVRAGRVRLRPILMTTIALVAGMIPLAIGLNEASKQRTSMGVAAIGGLISSTLLTLVVVPAAYTYIERFRVWSLDLMKRIFAPADPNKKMEVKHAPSNGKDHDHHV